MYGVVDVNITHKVILPRLIQWNTIAQGAQPLSLSLYSLSHTPHFTLHSPLFLNMLATDVNTVDIDDS